MFPYIGGKAHHVKWMDQLFPNDIQRFVEVFGGAGWVSVKSQRVDNSKYRVYNDFNPLLANVFECFRLDPERVLALMDSRSCGNLELYKQYQRELFQDLDWSTVELGNFELAVRYLYLQTQVFAGTPLSANNVAYFTEQKANGKYPSKYNTLKKKLANQEICDRLKSISRVENLDCVDLIVKHDSAETFFYVDPPYYKMEFYYSKDFPREKHQELARTLGNIQGKFALSYYDFDDLRQFYPEDRFYWHRQQVYRSAATRSSGKKNYNTHSKGTEILIMNYDPKSYATAKKRLNNYADIFVD